MENIEKSINLSIDVKLWKDVGVYASRNDKTKKEVVAMALQQFLASKPQQEAAK